MLRSCTLCIMLDQIKFILRLTNDLSYLSRHFSCFKALIFLFVDSCSSRDTSFTVTNFLHERSRRSVSEEENNQNSPELKDTISSVEGLEKDEDKIAVKEDGTVDENVAPADEKEAEGEQEASRQNGAPSGKGNIGERVDRLESVLLNMASSINHLRKEVRVLVSLRHR